MEPGLAIVYADSVVQAGAGPAKAAEALILKGRCMTMLDKPIQALQSFEKAVELPVDDSDPIAGQRFYYLGSFYESQKSMSRASEYFTQALELFEAQGDTVFINKTSLALGQIAYDNFNYDQALQLFERALSLAADSTSLQVAELKAAIGRLHYKNNDLHLAEPHLTSAYTLFETLGMGYSQVEVAEQLVALNKLDGGTNYRQAAEYAYTAHEIAHQAGNTKKALDLLLESAWLQSEMREYRESQSQLISAVELAQLHSPDDLPKVMIRLGEVYHILLDHTNAQVTLQDAYLLAEKNDDLSNMRDAAKALVSFLQADGDLNLALDYSKKSDSLNTLIHAQHLAQIQQEMSQSRMDEFDVIEQQKGTISELQDKQSTLEQWLIYGGLIILCIVVLVFIVEVVRRKKLSKVLAWKVYKKTAALRKANKDLNTYIYKSSHDLRTPLTSIKSLLRLIDTEEHTPSTMKYLGLIQGCAEQMDDILVNLSRAVDYRKIEVSVAKVDFDLVRHELEAKELPDAGNVKINWRINEKVPFYSDPKLIKVILNKTIGNAISYAKGSQYDYCNISITTDSQGAVFAIEDNGVGISSKVKASIFEMFVKGTNKSKGAGLGLYLVKIALDKLKGKVTVDSQENIGSKLIFQLPNLA